MWTVHIHPLVLEDDLAQFDPPVQRRLLSAIRARLTTNPKAYGAPLRGEYAGLWKLRVGDYRVIYRLLEQRVEVLILKVRARRDFEVYHDLLPRLKRLGH